MPGCNRTLAGYYANSGATQRITLWIRTPLTLKGSNGNSSATVVLCFTNLALVFITGIPMCV